MSLNPLDYASDEEYHKTLTRMDAGRVTLEDLSKKETQSLQNGTCPDCQGTEIFAGPKGPGAQNVLCNSCKMRFNVPTMRGPVGQRIGKLDEPKPCNPIKLPHEGSIIQGRGRTNVTAFALHNCSTDPNAEDHRGCVDIYYVGLLAYLVCRSCGMRYPVPHHIKTWEDLQKAFDKSEIER